MLHRLLLAAILALPIGASAQTALYAEALGGTGSIAVGVEQGLVASDSGDRHLAFRAGVAYRTDRIFFDAERLYSQTDRVVLVPVGAVASFSLGEALGFPLATDVGAGFVVENRTGGRFYPQRNAVALPVYGEVLLRAGLTRRLSVRAGVVSGGSMRRLSDDRFRPVAGVGFGL